jgi:hypothetical protein
MSNFRKVLALALLGWLAQPSGKESLACLKRRWPGGEGEILSRCPGMQCLAAIMGNSSLRCALEKDSCVVRGSEGLYAWACTDRRNGVDSLVDLALPLQRVIGDRLRSEDSAVARKDAQYRTCGDLGQDTIYAYEQVWASGRVERVRLSKSHFRFIEPPGAAHPGWVFYRNDLDTGYLDSPSAVFILQEEEFFASWSNPGWPDKDDTLPRRSNTGVPLTVLREISQLASISKQEAARRKAVFRKDSLETHCPGAVEIAAGRLNAPLTLNSMRTELLKSLKGRESGDTMRWILPNRENILFSVRGKGAWIEYQGKRLKNGEYPGPAWRVKFAFDKRRAPLCYNRLGPMELVVLPKARTLTLVGKDIFGFVDSVALELLGTKTLKQSP